MAEQKPYSYRDAGVDIAAGNALVEAIKPLAKATTRAGADADLGGFGGLFDLKAAGFKDPILCAATDGVGTKLKLACQTGIHDGVGNDLVAMCVNDLIVQGAEPLFFLDYFACGELQPETAETVIASIADGCKRAGAALIGGETAEMPGMYGDGDYDLAGFAVGAAERGSLLPQDAVKEGDVILGLAASGLHSNGFSLVRKIIEETGVNIKDKTPFSGKIFARELLTPTRIYVKSLLPSVKAGRIKALAHITGGGLVENLPRVLPAGLCADIDAGQWPLPPVFAWLRDAGRLPPDELLRTFNCGIGMGVVVDAGRADKLASTLKSAGEIVHRIGTVVGGDAHEAIVSGGAGVWGFDAPWRTGGAA